MYQYNVYFVVRMNVGFVQGRKKFGSGGIRTHAIEITGASNQRLRSLGHATCGNSNTVRLMFFGKEFLLSSGARICIKSKSPLPQSFDLLHKIGIYAHSIDSSSHWSYQRILIVTDAFCKIKGMFNLILQVDIKTSLSLQS